MIYSIFKVQVLNAGVGQCFFFSRNIGDVTPKIIYFHYLKNHFLDQSTPKNSLLKFENKSTGVGTLDARCCLMRFCSRR